MTRFKRNQVEAAISRVAEATAATPPEDVPTRLKRLLDTDRNLGCNAKSPDPEETSYAFYSEDAPGSGVEIWFRGYEAFALLIALSLLEHGFPQRRAVLALRAVRRVLETEHARVMKLDPGVLFDQTAVRRGARSGQVATSSTASIFLVIFTGAEAQVAGAKPRLPQICRGQAEMMRAIKDNRGPSTIFEIAAIAHLLHHHLSTTEPSQRGRAAG